MDRKFTSLLVLSLSVVLILSFGASARTTLTFWKHVHPPADALLKEIIAEFEAENPDIKIVVETVPHDQYIPKLLTAMTSGGGPDLFDLSDTDVTAFMKRNVFAPITYEALGFASQDEYESQWLPTSLDSFKNDKGEICGLPFEYNSWQLFINELHFEEAGLDPEKDAPKTWDDFLELAPKLTVTENGRIVRQGMAWPYGLAAGWYLLNFEPIVLQYGGSILSEDGTRAALDSEAALKAAQIWYDTVHTYKVTSPLVGVSSSANPNQDFADGNVAMWISGPWAAATLEVNPEVYNNYRVVNLPQADPDNPIFMTSAWAWFVAATSKHKEAAWKFIDFASQRQPQWLDRAGYIIPREGWFDTPEALAFKDLDVFLYGMANGRPRVQTEHYSEVGAALQRALDRIVMEGVKPADAMKQAQQEIDRVLQGY
ncbi:MAG: ABC transporter substrate-binding protein [Limnochordia bacterium]|jgi:multiple sugar transport system substrate-binding protein